MARNVVVVSLLALFVAAVVFVGWMLTRPASVDPSDNPSPLPEEEGPRDPGPLRAGRPGSLTGEVRVLATQEPAAGIEVEVTGSGDPLYVETDRAGRFQATAASGVNLRIRVIAPEPYATLEIGGIALDPGKSTSLGTLYLEKAFLVRGVVVDPRGQMVGGAKVFAYRPNAAPAEINILDTITAMGRLRVPLDETVAEDDGSFTLSRLSPGTYRLEAEAEGFARGFLTSAVVSPETAETVFRIVVATGTALSGTVRTEGGDPVEGAVVTTLRFRAPSMNGFDFQPVQATTDENGEFHFASLRPGQIGLTVGAEGYPLTIVERVDVGTQEKVNVTIGGSAAVAGKVSDADGEPIEGAEVLIAVGRRGGSFGRVRTDVDGKYRMEHLQAGRIQFLMVQKEGYPSYPGAEQMMGIRREMGTLEEGKTLTKDITLKSGAVVTGVVTDSSTGRAVVGAEVSLRAAGPMFGFGSTASAITDESGVFRLAGAAEGKHLLLVKAAGFVQPGLSAENLQALFMPGRGDDEPPPDAPMIVIGPNVSEVKKDLTVVPGVTISGVVVDVKDQPVGGARVSVDAGTDPMAAFMRMGFEQGSALTNPSGEFRITGARANPDFRLKASAEGYVDGLSSPQNVAAGASLDGVKIRLGAGGTLSGIVLGPDGMPVTGASVRAIPWAKNGRGPAPTWMLGQARVILTDAEGAFEVTGLKPGNILLGIEAPGCPQLINQDLSVAEGEVSGGHVFSLEQGLEISGTVRDDRGQAVPEVRGWVRLEERNTNRPWSGRGGQVRFDDDGTFVVDGLSAGNYTVSVSAAGYASETIRGVAAGTNALEIILMKGLEISGRVLLPDGSPAANCRVRANPQDATREGGNSSSDRTDAEGRFKIENLKSGSYTIIASGPGPRGPQPVSVNAREARMEGVAAGTVKLVIRLQAGFIISGTVVDEGGNPIAGVWVAARPTDGDNPRQGPSGNGRTGDDGAFEVMGLDDGEYRLNAYAQGYGPGMNVQAKSPSSGLRIELKKGEPRAPGLGR